MQELNKYFVGWERLNTDVKTGATFPCAGDDLAAQEGSLTGGSLQTAARRMRACSNSDLSLHHNILFLCLLISSPQQHQQKHSVIKS